MQGVTRALFVLLLPCACGPSEPASTKPAPSPEAKVLESLTPVQVAVANGESALLRLSDGYAILSPTMEDINNGKYELLISKDGKFDAPGVERLTASGRMVDREVLIRSHRIRLSGESDKSVWIRTDLEDGLIRVANIGKTRREDVDLSEVKFQNNVPTDRDAFLQMLKQKGYIR
jgi:hypothetical protein